MEPSAHPGPARRPAPVTPLPRPEGAISRQVQTQIENDRRMSNSSTPPAAGAESTQPFGVFAPRGTTAWWIAVTRHTFLGRGRVRRLVWRLLKNRPQPCYDLMVRGTRMRLFPFDNTVERKLIFRPDQYCQEEIRYLLQVLAGGGTYVDIGANVGALTLPIAKLSGVRVIAVEPGPLALQRLRFNLQANGFD
jgi:hypothetical protein